MMRAEVRIRRSARTLLTDRRSAGADEVSLPAFATHEAVHRGRGLDADAWAPGTRFDRVLVLVPRALPLRPRWT